MSPAPPANAPLVNGRRGRPADPAPGGATPRAHDFARVLAALERRAEETARYLPELRCRTVEALGELGYEEIDAHLAERSSLSPEVAVAATLSVVMKLPGTELRQTDFSLSLPLVLTHSGDLRVSGAEIGGFTVRETFVHSLDADPAQVARVMTHGLSRLYMAHLLSTGGPGAPSQAQTHSPRRVFVLEESR